jgi:ribosomal protein L37AE/L43A
MRKLVDITGTEYVAPNCPNCSTKNTKYALVQLEELNGNLQKSGGVWRCGHCFHAFRYENGI